MELRQRSATVLFSGGIDSASCAQLLLQHGLLVRGLFVNYGQPAADLEATASISLAKRLSIPLETKVLSTTPKLGAGELVGRNAMLIFCALFFTQGYTDLISIGIHSGSPYFDCTESFFSSAGQLVAELTDGRVALSAPFISWTKKDVFDYFVAAGLPVALTYSCEAGTDPVCGYCASCKDRKALGC